ncbi:MAG: DUF262 domain-containing protein [Gomphosphaeria aponina SAG 52.96 = DSM 107014]|uniref:DUF262 domain-containing protein n=1 Tax=Gomphosphaeria aponina SAG 52.96 = DSM 107014 TaxID=1521640 RepID=A0A941JRB8_9CHRO|nr:DUF262 domain-containing protein [Gomphosphaeria aponina SAG 52.96 = DSM 107014]
MQSLDLDQEIDQKIGEVRTDSLDISFGEIISLYTTEELIIEPEYQRLFRWSNQQKSRLIESILLELPIPQIFTIENIDGVLELIDGLQRISSIIQFINASILELEPLKLEGCDQILALNDKTYKDLSVRLQLRIKRSSVRTVIIKRQSKPFLRYEMFKRLNTGGSLLSPQEIRNCSARMVGEAGIKFYNFLQEMTNYSAFSKCIETLSESEKNQRGDEELVLRFFAAKNERDLFRRSVRDWLDNYMENILLNKINFDYEKEEKDFKNLFDYLALVLGNSAFVRHRNESAIGALAPAYYEAVTIGTFNVLDKVQNLDNNLVKSTIIKTIQSDSFKDNIGSGANTKAKLTNRIKEVEESLIKLVNGQ